MSSLVSASEIGLFRANPNANVENTLRLVDPNTPGTTGTDTLSAFDITTGPSVKVDGVKYIDKNSTEHFLRFFNQDNPTAEKTYYSIEFALTTAAELQAAIAKVIEQYEVNPIVTVSVSGDAWTFVHKGAGTLDDIVIDGSDEATART